MSGMKKNLGGWGGGDTANQSCSEEVADFTHVKLGLRDGLINCLRSMNPVSTLENIQA